MKNFETFETMEEMDLSLFIEAMSKDMTERQREDFMEVLDAAEKETITTEDIKLIKAMVTEY